MKFLTMIAVLFFCSPTVQAGLCLDLQLSERQILEVQKEINSTTAFTKSEKQKVIVYANEAFSVSGLRFETINQFLKYLQDEDMYRFNEFNFLRIKIKSSGERFTYIWSYPGDNEYGLWIDENNEIVAANSDGDLSVGNQWCDYIDQD